MPSKTARPRVIDVHSHWYPPSYLALLRRRDQPPRVVAGPDGDRLVPFRGGAGWALGEEFVDPAAKLRFMDTTGIDQAVVTLGNPWLEFSDPRSSPAAAREVNRELAALEGETGGKLVGAGVLPSRDVRAAIDVAGEVAGTSTLHGLVSGTTVCGLELDAPALEPLWELLACQKLTLFLHPGHGFDLGEVNGSETVMKLAVGFPLETTAALTRLVLSGVLTRHPDLRVVAAHGGGAIPYLGGRVDAVWRSEAAARVRLGHPPSEDLSRLYLDALVYDAAALDSARRLVGVDRLMFGTDHPFPIGQPEPNLRAIESTLRPPERRLVLGKVASDLLALPKPER